MATTRLYDLLPALYRMRDAQYAEREADRPLFALVQVLQQQLEVLEEDHAQLHDDLFIESCAEWAIPYLGDLIGYKPLHPVTVKTAQSRAEVANTIGYRRRKGTAAMLEQLAQDVTGWDARVVEFFQFLAMTQHMNHVREGYPSTADLRDWKGLERISSAFDGCAHTVDVRSVAQGGGRYNLPNVGIFLWRLSAYSLTDSPAVPVGDSSERFLFNPLGCDGPLITRPESEEDVLHLASEINVPAPISRRVLDEDLDLKRTPMSRYYGLGKSFSLTLRENGKPVSVEPIRICDLSDKDASGVWAHVPVKQVTVDPVLGRLALPPLKGEGSREVLVTYHYAFGTDLGGGEYEREASFAEHPPASKIIQVPLDQPTIQQGLNALGAGGGIVEITSSGRFVETLQIAAGAGATIELRAANDVRPIIVMSGALQITGDQGAKVFLNGLVITGGSVALGGNLERCTFTHMTLVPGRSLNRDGTPAQPAEPSLIAEAQHAVVAIERSILGGIRTSDDTLLRINDSLVDATVPGGLAIGGLQDAEGVGPKAGGLVTITASTVFGRVHVERMDASNVIFAAASGLSNGREPVFVNRRQEGCVRFSYVPLGSRTPRRHRCQPELGIAQAIDKE